MSGRDTFNTLAPEYTIKVNGQALPKAALADVVRLSVLEDVDAPGMFELTIAAWDTAQMKAKWIDDALFDEGNPVEIAFGYRDDTQPQLSGEITGLEPDFPEGQAPTLRVRGHDRLHRLMRARRTRSYVDMKDSEIAAQVASGAGLTANVTDSAVKLPYVLQHDQTDLEFLKARACRIEFELAVQGRELLFRPRRFDASATLTLHREIELLAFHPCLSTLGQVTAIEVRGWDPATKKEIVGKAGAGDEGKLLGNKASGPAATQKAFGAAASARVDMPVASQGEADKMAKQAYAEMALRYIRAEGLCIGEPRLRAGIVVEIQGLGTRFSGAYYVTSVEHSFTPKKGYRTAFSARRNAT